MDRKLLITIHMYLSSFFAPAVLLVAISGGLYLIGIKGEVEQETIYRSEANTIDSSAPSLKGDVEALLRQAGVEGYSFEYVKVKGATLYTRPTSTDHYMINLKPDEVEVVSARPSLQKRMIELHMGHGPTAYKTYQQVFAAGMLFIILSGLWLGLSSARLRLSTAVISSTGVLLFLWLALW